MKLCDVGEAPFLEIMSYLDVREMTNAQFVCRTLRQNSPMIWTQKEKTLGSTGEDATAQGRCCRFFKASKYAERMQDVALRHYDYNDPEPTHVKCWCCQNFPNLEARVFRHPQKYEFFCRFSDRIVECNPRVIWEGFCPSTKISYSGLSLDVSEIFCNIRMKEDFGTYMFRSSERNFVSMCDVTDSLMVTVVAVERSYPWRTSLVLATGGFHDCTTTHHDPNTRCFRFHPRMVRSHGITRDEDYITAGFVTSTARLGDPLQDCRMVLEHQW